MRIRFEMKLTTYDHHKPCCCVRRYLVLASLLAQPQCPSILLSAFPDKLNVDGKNPSVPHSRTRSLTKTDIHCSSRCHSSLMTAILHGHLHPDRQYPLLLHTTPATVICIRSYTTLSVRLRTSCYFGGMRLFRSWRRRIAVFSFHLELP